jgi:hypothetical protein
MGLVHISNNLALCCIINFEISDLYDFGLGFISSLPQFIWD